MNVSSYAPQDTNTLIPLVFMTCDVSISIIVQLLFRHLERGPALLVRCGLAASPIRRGPARARQRAAVPDSLLLAEAALGVSQISDSARIGLACGLCKLCGERISNEIKLSAHAQERLESVAVSLRCRLRFGLFLLGAITLQPARGM